MKIMVLGSSGAEFPGHNPPAFLLDEILLLDAGTIGSMLVAEQQERIRHICVTHSHLDHIRGIPALADNIVICGRNQSVNVISISEVLAVLKEHLMNGQVWPDFTVIPAPDAAAVTYQEIVPEQEVILDGFSITACRVNHSVPAVGYIVRKGDKSLLYTGDSGPTDRIWRLAGSLSAMIIEVSFPNEMENMALLTGHMTSRLLRKELSKMKTLPPRIFITHLKPQFGEIIAAELAALGLPQIELLQDGVTYEL